MENSNQSPADSERLQKLTYLLDRQEILDCLTKVSRGIDRFDREMYVSAFHPDAVIDAGLLVGSPEMAFDEGATLHEHGQSSTLHNLLNHSCEIEGDMAHAETYFLFVGRNRDGSNWSAGGRYVDRLERRHDGWKIAVRCTVLEWSGTIPTANVPLFENVPDVHLNGAPSRSRDDVSYRRPLTNRRTRQAPANSRELGVPQTG